MMKLGIGVSFDVQDYFGQDLVAKDLVRCRPLCAKLRPSSED